MDDTTITWAERIRTSVARSVEAILDTGQTLIDCKASLLHGEFEEAVRLAGMSPAAARKLMSIARNPVLSNRSHANDLPVSSETLSILARMEPAALETAIGEGVVGPGIGRTEAKVIAGRDKTVRQFADVHPQVGSTDPATWSPEPVELLLRDSGEWADIPSGVALYCQECGVYLAGEPATGDYENSCPHCASEPENVSEKVTEEFDNWVMEIAVTVGGKLPLRAISAIPGEQRSRMILELEKAEIAIAQLVDTLRDWRG